MYGALALYRLTDPSLQNGNEERIQVEGQVGVPVRAARPNHKLLLSPHSAVHGSWSLAPRPTRLNHGLLRHVDFFVAAITRYLQSCTPYEKDTIAGGATSNSP